jgi:RHS repeat-associated protein
MSSMAALSQVGDLEYSYDVDGRVIEKTGSLAATGIPSAVSGNTFNLANEMTAFNGTHLSYDLNGNLLNDGTNTYTWDARNHLATLTGAGSLPTTASFIYDALGRRAEKTINQQTTAFLYDGWNSVQELAPSGLGQFAPTANMLTGLGIDEFFQRTDANGAQSFISDALGSALALTNPVGSISTSYIYEPFGTLTNPSATDTNPFQFTGRENDGTGLYFYRARYYSPMYQRFIAQDSLALTGAARDFAFWHFPSILRPSYVFVENNPLALVDPFGLCGFPGISGPFTGYNWCGPGNNPNDLSDTNPLDACCELHDKCYDKCNVSSGDVPILDPGNGNGQCQRDCDGSLCMCAYGKPPGLVHFGIHYLFCY